MRGADAVVEALRAAGVRVVFSLSGNQIMPIYDALVGSGIDIVHVRHEAAAAFMADAWAQLTGEVGVALVTAAPGFVNALGALYSARQSESPVLLLSGDAAIGQDGRGAFQELDQVAISAPLTKRSLRSVSADAVGGDIADAIALALSGRPGPVHVALPFDVVQAAVSSTGLAARASSAPLVVTDGDAAAVVAAIAGAARPLVLLGPRSNGTRQPGMATRLADALDAPAIVMESPRGLNDPAAGALARIVARADLIVALGKRIDFTLGFARPPAFDPACRWIVVDPEPAAIGQAQTNLGARLERAMAADVYTAAEALIRHGRMTSAGAAWRAEVAAAVAWRAFDAAKPGSDGRVAPTALCAAVQRAIDAAGDAVLIVDGGEFGQWAQACLKAPARIINGPAGAIGGGLCFSLGAKLARPAATVFSLMGDGSSGFHLGEFETAVRYHLPFVAVIGNDARWNAEYQIQMRDYGRDRLIGCELDPTRYDLAVTGLGGHGEHVTRVEELDAALTRAAASGKPACVNVMIDGWPAPSGAGH